MEACLAGGERFGERGGEMEGEMGGEMASRSSSGELQKRMRFKMANRSPRNAGRESAMRGISTRNAERPMVTFTSEGSYLSRSSSARKKGVSTTSSR